MTPDTAVIRMGADQWDRVGTPMPLATYTVRALCDAADEVERLRGEVASLRTLRMEINQGFGGPATIKVWRDNVLRFNGVDLSALLERDASRTAHAALVADLRALHRPTAAVDGESEYDACVTCFEEYERPATYPCATATLLDRHSPTTGATP